MSPSVDSTAATPAAAAEAAAANGPDGSSGGSGSSGKRMKLTGGEKTPVIGQFLDVDDDDDGGDDAATGAITTNNAAAEAEARAAPPSSVKKLQGWLSDFERKQREHYERVPHRSSSSNQNNNGAAAASSKSAATPPRPSAAAAPTPAPTPAQNPAAAAAARAPHTDVVRARTTSLGGSGRSTATPGRMLFGGSSTSGQAPRTCGSATKPRAAARRQSSSVEATNDGYAPVSKLSAWLEDDPTSKKKNGGLPLASRRGRNVSAKSRRFEPLPPNDATRTVEFRRNGVSERKQWLESAFKKDGDGANKAGGQAEDGMSVADRAKWLQGAFAKKKEENKVRRDDDGHANVAYAEVGPEEEFIASGGAGDVAAAAEKQDGPNNREDDNATLTSSSTCSSFSIGKQMLESRTEKNSSRGVGQQPQEEEEEDLRASVQIRRAALEQREEESRAHADADRRRSVGRAVRAHWEVGGGSASAQSYTKTYVPEDDRRCTPAKKLSDLP